MTPEEVGQLFWGRGTRIRRRTLAGDPRSSGALGHYDPQPFQLGIRARDRAWRGPAPGQRGVPKGLRHGAHRLRSADDDGDDDADPALQARIFAALAVAMLARDGAISLDAPVWRHVPEVPAYAGAVTVRHLVHHTTGSAVQRQVRAGAAERVTARRA